MPKLRSKNERADVPNGISTSKVYVVGVGPGDPEYLTLKAKRVIQASDIVVGFEPSLLTIDKLVKGKLVLTLTLENENQVLAGLAKKVRSGKICSVTCTGDPNFVDLEFIDIVRKFLGEVEIIPGISSIQIAASKLMLPLDKIKIMAFFVRDDMLEQRKSCLLDCVREGRRVLVLPRPWGCTPSDISEYLLAHKIDIETPVTIFENLTLGDERTFVGNLKGVVGKSFSDKVIMIVGVVPSG